MPELTLVIAFVAGLISFLSPCVFPLIPGFLAYLGGALPGRKPSRWATFSHSVAFVLGFAIVFSVLGVLLQSALSGVASQVQQWLNWLGGAVIIFFGLLIAGLIQVDFLSTEHKFAVKKSPDSGSSEGFGLRHYLTSALFGASFAVGWSPCVGAVLGTVLTLAATNPSAALPLMLSYALGLGIPFLLVGAFASEMIGWMRGHAGFLKYFNYLVGAILVVLGVLVFTGNLAKVGNLLVTVVNP
jgi:cytochrome c-type biogenesis protein